MRLENPERSHSLLAMRWGRMLGHVLGLLDSKQGWLGRTDGIGQRRTRVEVRRRGQKGSERERAGKGRRRGHVRATRRVF